MTEQSEWVLLALCFLDAVAEAQAAWRRVVRTAVDLGVPVPVFSSALAYYDGYRRERSPANLIRDCATTLAHTATAGLTGRVPFTPVGRRTAPKSRLARGT